MTCLAVAASMFPAHPHAAAWNEKGIEYMMNTLSVPQDALDNTLVDGRPVSEWFVGANLNPDFTLENHNYLPSLLHGVQLVFPDASRDVLHLRRPASSTGGNPPPAGYLEDVSDDHTSLRRVCLPPGHGLGTARPELHQSLCLPRQPPPRRPGRPPGGQLPAIHPSLADHVPRGPGGSRLPPRIHPARHLRRAGLLRLSGPQNLRPARQTDHRPKSRLPTPGRMGP